MLIACFDENLSSSMKFHDNSHEYELIEIPKVATGLPVH